MIVPIGRDNLPHWIEAYPYLDEVQETAIFYADRGRLEAVLRALWKIRPEPDGTLRWVGGESLGPSTWHNPLCEMHDHGLLVRAPVRRRRRYSRGHYVDWWHRIEPRGELLLALEDDGDFPAPPTVPTPDPRQLRLPFGSMH